jgi:hypothetical protein
MSGQQLPARGFIAVFDAPQQFLRVGVGKGQRRPPRLIFPAEKKGYTPFFKFC